MALSRIVIMIMIVAVSVVTSLDDVCTLCHCENNDIVCNCDKKKELNFSHVFIKLRKEASMSISNCEYVKFSRMLGLNATRVDVRNVTSLEIEKGSFGFVDDLEIREVALLRLRSFAFDESHVRSLLVEDSHIESVENNALIGLREMRRLQLIRVTIDDVQSDALGYYNAKEQSDVLIRDTQIRKIQEHGIGLHVANITIQNCSFQSVEDYGIYLNSLSQLRVTENTFENLKSPRSLKVNGHVVYVTGNSFSLFPTDFLKHSFKEFVENEFQFPISNLSNEIMNKMAQNLYNNSFTCECSDAFGKGLTLLQDEGHDELLQKTFCISRECPRRVTHEELLRELKKVRCALHNCGVHHLLTTLINWLLLHIPTLY